MGRSSLSLLRRPGRSHPPRARAVRIPASRLESRTKDGCRPPRCGYGKCTKCNCQAFEGNAGTCANAGCGHAYQDHW
jgi:hypothetical protein